MKLMRAVSLIIALLLLAIATALHLDGKWGHLPTVVALASATYGVIALGFHFAVYKRKASEN